MPAPNAIALNKGTSRIRRPRRVNIAAVGRRLARALQFRWQQHRVGDARAMFRAARQPHLRQTGDLP